MKKNFNCILILFVAIIGNATSSYSQNKKADSLLILLKNDTQDTNKVLHLNALGWQVMFNNPDTAILIGNQALLISQKLSASSNKALELAGKKGLTVSLSQLGVYAALKADYSTALDYFLQALKAGEEMGNSEDPGNKKLNGDALLNIGNIYCLQGDYPQALDYYLKALKISEELGNKNRISTILVSIGTIYYTQGDFPKGLEYYLRALKIVEEIGDKNGIALTLGNIANIYSDQATSALTSPTKRGELQSKALEYYFKTLKIDEELGDKIGMATVLGNIGTVYEEQGDFSADKENWYPKAFTNYFKALKLSEELGNKEGIADWLSSIGSLYTKTEKYTDAYTYLYKALAISDSIGASDDVKKCYNVLSTLYEKSNVSLPDTVGGKTLNKEGMRLRSLYYFKKYLAIRDTLFGEENKKQLVSKELNYEFGKKEALINAEHEKEVAIKEAESKRQKLFILLVTAVALAIGIIAVIILRALRITKKQKNIMGQQKEIIEKKNKQITDSINYAQRIQNNLLPDHEELSSVFPHSFVFLQPKDVVSGDFYWYKQIGKYFYLCVADCTGHGVPGAFMSIIGIDSIEQAILDKQITEPAAILNFINQAVLSKTHLKDDTEVIDGMDTVLIRINLENKKISLAGARNPLIIVRNGEILEIKTDKLSVGQLKENDSFSQFEIDIYSHDNIYLFSDGYADQKGGSEKKKFMMSEFRKLLIETTLLSSPEKQKEQVMNTLINWMDNCNQVDDILVVGVKII